MGNIIINESTKWRKGIIITTACVHHHSDEEAFSDNLLRM